MKKYDNIKMDLFEERASDWILYMEGENKFFDGELITNTNIHVLESIRFNVIDAYRCLIRFPDSCPSCTRNGRNHDGECETPEWKGKDYGIFKEK